MNVSILLVINGVAVIAWGLCLSRVFSADSVPPKQRAIRRSGTVRLAPLRRINRREPNLHLPSVREKRQRVTVRNPPTLPTSSTAPAGGGHLDGR